MSAPGQGSAFSSLKKRISEKTPPKLKGRSMSYNASIHDSQKQEKSSGSTIEFNPQEEKPQWKRSPEANAIMQMLKKEAEKDIQGTKEERQVIQIEKKKAPAPPPRRGTFSGTITSNEIPESFAPTPRANVVPELLQDEGVQNEGAELRSYLNKLSTPRSPIPPSRTKQPSPLSITDTPASESNKEESNLSTTSEQSAEKIVWKRNPEAERIRNMLLQEVGGDSPVGSSTVSVNRRGTVSIDPTAFSLSPVTSPVISPRGGSSPRQEDHKKDKKIRKTTMSGRLFSLNRSGSKKQMDSFSITRSDDESQAGLDNLGREFAEFQSTPSATPPKDVVVAQQSPTAPERKEIDKRTQIVLEIRSSERSYVQVLETLKEDYYATLMKQAKEKLIDISESTIKQIFSNISLICNINQNLFSEINGRVSNWNDTQTIGDIFGDVIPYLKIYDQYGNNYDNSLEILKECQKSIPFMNVLSQIEQSTETNLRLESLLIAPIQRLPRYILLLTDLKKNTPKDHPDWALLEEAIPAMQNVADHVDKYIHQAKGKQKLVELSSGGASSLLLAHRNLLTDCELRCENKKKSTAFYVFNDLLVHLSANKAKNKPNLTLPCHQWPLHLIWFQYPSQDTVHIIGPTTESYILKFGIPENNQFISALHTAVEEDLKKQTERRDASAASPTVETPHRFGSYQFANSVVYIGQWVNGKVLKMQGEGKWKFMDHEYDGEFMEDKKAGKGRMKYFSGNIYTGEWDNDLPHGKGVLEYPTGEIYEGEFSGGTKNGYGTMKFSNGDVFDGYWKDNKPEGLGTFQFHSGSVYSGNFKNGRFHNYGVLSCTTTKTKYEGEWVNGFREGKGRMEYQDGSIYDGFWKAGLREGNGTFTSNNEGTYTGEWMGDLKHGKGSMEFLSKNVYDGYWKQGMFHGHGKMIYAAGSITLFDGEWVQNMKTGKGIMHYVNGDTYEGYFKDDIMHGTGTYTFANGLVVTGKWTNGVQEGKTTISTLYKKDHQTHTGTLKNNLWNVSDKTPSLHFHTLPDLRFDPW